MTFTRCYVTVGRKFLCRSWMLLPTLDSPQSSKAGIQFIPEGVDHPSADTNGGTNEV